MPSWLWYTLLAAFWGSLAVVFAKAGLNEASEYLALFVRTAILFLTVIAFVLWSGQLKDIITLSKKAVLLLVATGLSTSLYWVFYYKALKIANAHYVAALDKGGIIFTVLLSLIIFREPFSLKTAIGILLIIAGCVLLVTNQKE